MATEQELAGMRIAHLNPDQLRTLAHLLNVNGWQEMSDQKLMIEVRRKQRRILKAFGNPKPAL